MSSLKLDRKDKPESYKLIRQLICYLFLKNQNQLCIERFIDSDVPPESRKTAIYKQYRTFFRYIGEILHCLKDESDYEDDWYTIYSEGSFYRGYDFILHESKTWPCETKHINPIKPSPAHEYRLWRTMHLAQEIVDCVVNENRDNLPQVQFFQAVIWPNHKVKFRTEYLNENRDLELRTVQRDMRTVFSAVTQYFEMSELQEKDWI